MAQTPWTSHRSRAVALCGRYPFAAELLTLYLALLDVWETGWELARAERPAPRKLAAWATERILPGVVTATGAAGPPPLAAATRELSTVEGVLAAWLAGGALDPVGRYLARASLCAPLVALGADAGQACADDPAPRDERHCPHCGGVPQLRFRGDAGDRLGSGRRDLGCAPGGHRCDYQASA